MRVGSIAALFFDLDGTLMDHKGAAEAAVVRLLARYRLDGPSRETAVDLWHQLNEDYIGRYLAGAMSFAEQRRARVRDFFEHFGFSCSPQEADEAFSFYLGYYEQGWGPFPDAIPTLDALGGLRKGVITNGDAEQQRKKLKVLGLTQHFETLVISGEVGVSKPDSEIFREACARIRLEPSSCAYVGDKLEHDALAAREAGMLGIWLNRERAGSRGSPLPEHRFIVVEELTELASLFGQKPCVTDSD